MNPAILPWLAGALCVFCGSLALFFRPGALASWIFFAGMSLLALETLADYRAALAAGTPAVEGLLRRSILLKSFIPGVWLGFSLVYARGNSGEFLRRWKWELAAALIVPPAIALAFSGRFLSLEADAEGTAVRFLTAGKVWVVVVLLLNIGILANIEKTFRSSVGMSRWRIKYLCLGTAMIFGVKLYALSQILLFSAYHPDLALWNTVGVIVGCGLIVVGHSRSSFGDFDLYPSRAVLQGSLTVILAGGYFLIVGVLAQVVTMLGGAASFPAQVAVVLLGVVGLTVLLLSERFRTGLQRFVSRHFRRAEHDFRKIWTEFTRRTSSVLDAETLGKNSGEVIAENFHVLGVTVFRLSADSSELILVSSTEQRQETGPIVFDPSSFTGLADRCRPFNLESREGLWAENLRRSCPRKFDHGGDRLVIPLQAAERLEGLVVLADRVNGVPYSHEELDLLGCIGDQLAAALLNCTLTEEVLQAKELEAFQTLSTFFVHDLKNAANSLNLTLQNLPIHFDDPEFRADAVRAVGRTVERINQMILKLSSLRHELQLRREPCRLDLLCAEVLDGLEPEMPAGLTLVRSLEPLPERDLDKEAFRSVVTNLLVNAGEASPQQGSLVVATRADHGRLTLTVTDQGTGMSADFIRNQLFRPFYSTKTKGLGIGMFQCKKIVEAHHGAILVHSTVGAGTCFTISLPTNDFPAPPKQA